VGHIDLSKLHLTVTERQTSPEKQEELKKLIGEEVTFDVDYNMKEPHITPEAIQFANKFAGIFEQLIIDTACETDLEEIGKEQIIKALPNAIGRFLLLIKIE
jgi:hypothetical protein